MEDNEVIDSKPKSKKDLKFKDIFNTRGKRGAGYFLLTFLELYVFSILFTGSMEYYMTDASENFFSYVITKYFLFYFYDIPRYVFSFSKTTSAEFYHAFSIVIFLIIVLFVFFVFQRGYIAILTGGTLGMLLCYASKIKFRNRMEFLNIQDLSLTEAAGMATKYLTPEFGIRFLALLFIMLLFGVAAFFTDRLILKDRKAMIRKEKLIFWGIRVSLGLLMILAFFHYQSRINHYLMQGDVTKRMLFLSDHPTDYVVYHFFENKTTSYSKEEVEKTYNEIRNTLTEQFDKEAYKTASADEYPNVIVIMSESWWYLDHTDPDKMVLSQDPFGPLKELGDKVSWGSASVNIFGGGTISSETEFLTGWNSKYFRNSISVVSDQTGRKNHSLVEYFNALGYDTHGIHPFFGEFYNRRDLYENLGFDHITFEPDMKYREPFDRYISDGALADQIIYEFENRSADKAFIFSVSVASHSTYMGSPTPFNDDYPYIVSMERGKNWAPFEEWDETAFNGFKRLVNGFYESSAAYAKLVSYFESQDEPVILVMFGDHCPGVEIKDLADVGILKGGNDKNWVPTAVRENYSEETIADIELLYSVPVVSWSNCLDDADMDMSMNNLCVLGSRILQKAKLPMTEMTLLEDYYESQLATDNNFFMIDPDQNLIFRTTDEIDESIRIKTLIQYDLMYGDDICKDVWLPMTD